eukprot:jgi/Phyca11/16764/fgenesh1_pg.PHYCAscaffold_22_\
MNTEKRSSIMNPMASRKTQSRTTGSDRSARKQTATSPAEPAPRFDELPTAERNAKTAKGKSQKSPEAQEQERREHTWEIDLREKDQSDCGSTSGTLNNCGAKDDYGATSMRIEEIKKIVAQEPPLTNHMNYKKEQMTVESGRRRSQTCEGSTQGGHGEADVSPKIDVKTVNQFQIHHEGRKCFGGVEERD